MANSAHRLASQQRRKEDHLRHTLLVYATGLENGHQNPLAKEDRIALAKVIRQHLCVCCGKIAQPRMRMPGQ